MAAFKFDATKRFDENLESFLSYMEKEDPEMGAILRAHIDTLKGPVNEASRSSGRTSFNTSVLADLNDLLPTENGGEEE